MAVIDQKITDKYALYNGDCVEVLATLPANSVDMSIYSPPFSGLYNYSSDDQDMSNCKNDDEFLEHYGFLIEQVSRLTKPGRHTVVHCADVPKPRQTLSDFPGDVIRLHQKHGFDLTARYSIWKEPLRVAIRTRALGLTHRQIVKDSTLCGNAGADYILSFRKRGENQVSIAHPDGLRDYAGEREVPEGFIEKYSNWEDPRTNKLSQWIWQQYASSIWDDIRVGHVLPYKAARDPEDEKHVHPLQLDVIERCCVLWSNPNDVVMTPFMGVGSEVYGAVVLGRRGLGVELKSSYFRQAVKNLQEVTEGTHRKVQKELFDFESDNEPEETMEFEPST
jgi:DNA modification methylase